MEHKSDLYKLIIGDMIFTTERLNFENATNAINQHRQNVITFRQYQWTVLCIVRNIFSSCTILIDQFMLMFLRSKLKYTVIN